MTPLTLLAAALGATALWLALATLRASKTRQAARAGYFDRLPFDKVTKRIELTGFPRLTAHLGADAFDLQAVPDNLTFRKLPALWVMVTLPVPLPVQATLDIMARPAGNEPFSHFARLPHSLPCRAELPEGTGIRSDNAAALPPFDRIAPHLGLFADHRVKELVISPKGLRLVILADEADRGRYLIFRDLETGKTPLAPSRILPLIDTLRALRDSLSEAK